MPTEPWRGTVAVMQEAAAGSWRAAEQELLSSACSEPSSAVAGCGTCW